MAPSMAGDRPRQGFHTRSTKVLTHLHRCATVP